MSLGLDIAIAVIAWLVVLFGAIALCRMAARGDEQRGVPPW
jgi:hypothetical protein